MALNLSKFFGAKPAQADSGDVSTVGEGTASANLLDADGKFGPETEAAVIDTSGPAVSPLESENGGLDTTPEEPGFGEPVVGSAILYNGHANLGDNAIALDTWEHAAMDTGLGGPDTTERSSILPHIEPQPLMRDGSDNVTLENFALNRDGAPERDGIMVWNGEPVSHGIAGGTLAGSTEPEAAQDVFVTEVVSRQDGISVFGSGGGVDDVREAGRLEYPNLTARADHPVADDVAFSLPEVDDEVLLSDVAARTPSGLKFDTEVTDYAEGGTTAAKWELSEYDATRNESSAGGTDTNQVWDDTDIVHVTAPLESKNEVSIESIKIEHEGFAATPLPDYNPKELWEASRREGDARIDSAAGLGFESQTRPHADGLRDDDGPSSFLGEPRVSDGVERIKFNDFDVSSIADSSYGDGDAESLADLDIDV
jgi:hypothetical protein